MKFGYRKPSIKKSIKARTTGKVKRRAKKAINPLYGQKGMGWINNPKKAAYNKVYNKTSKSIINTNSSKNNKPISWTKLCVGLCTGGLSLLFTGIHKNKSKKDKK